MERYLGYIVNIAAGVGDGPLQPVYRINGDARARRARSSTSLPGYRGMGPVRVGNDAYRQVQHDVYGSADPRGDARLLRRAARPAAATSRCSSGSRRSAGARSPSYDQPDAGPLGAARQRARAHVLERHVLGGLRPARAHRGARSGSPSAPRHGARDADAHPRASSTSAAGTRSARASSRTVDGDDARREPAAARRARASSPPDDPRFVATVARDRARAEARRLRLPLRRARRFRRAGERVRRLHVLVRQRAGRARPPRRGARAVRAAARVPQPRTACSPSTSTRRTGELWGNFVQTYSMVGLITSAIRLSLPWDEAF